MTFPSDLFRKLCLVMMLCTQAGMAAFASGMQAGTSESYARAEALIRQGQWDEGIATLEPLVASRPPNPKALNLIGIALTGKGELKEANAQFEHALQLDPQFLPALKNLAINEFSLQELRASERHLIAASIMASDDPVIHAHLREIAFHRRDYPHAAEELSRAGKLLQLNPDFAAHLTVGELESGQREKALSLLDELDPGRLSPRSQFELGYALAQHGLFTQATPYFEAVARSCPASYDAGYNLSVCYLQAKEYARAVSALEALISQEHQTAELENLLAQAYESNHQTKEAVAALQEAIHIAPEDGDNYVDLVTLCVNHDAYDLGMEVLKVGLHYHPKSARLIFQRGVLHAMHDGSSYAEKDFELASKLAPDKNFSYIGMGLNSIQTGDLPHAIQLLRRRIREKSGDFMLHYLLGKALIQPGADPGDPQFG